ncbi:MAG: DUF1674 domain-containing protein [Hoeflea sp.]|uniref:DUF1674 domain-containing protein n=1 Tax=Hoeflea sp. TaxID=1940281 RepID=UPI0032F03BAB
MTDDTDKSESGDTRAEPDPASGRKLSAAARRALAEAEERRKARKADEQKPEREIGGRGGADPARFGDWEINGRAIDF